MKIIITILIGILSCSINAQTWFDSSCKNIDDKVIQEEFESSSERNVFKVIINQADEVEINDQVKEGLGEIAFKELVLDFVTNPKGDKNKADKPEKVFIQLKSFNKNSKKFESLKSYIQGVYLYLWDKEADEKYKSTYIDLNCKKREKVFNAYPLRMINEVEKNNNSKSNKPMRRGPGLPPFGGDVKKN
jgi:hypothetical protein